MVVYFLKVLLLLMGLFCDSICVRVCESFSDYNNIFPNQRCKEDPVTNFKQIDVIKSWGLSAEAYSVETDDDYIITVVRAYKNITKEHPVVLGHGFLLNAYSFLSQGYKSLTYLLAQKGYDVWIVNFRGSKQSRAHKYLSDSKKEYWQFSFDEMGNYDLPAVFNHAESISRKSRFIYIGFSMSGNIGYIFSLEHPREAKEKLVKMISLAPAALLLDVKGVFKTLVRLLPILKQIHPIFNIHDQFLPLLAKGYFGKFCNAIPPNLLICEFLKGAMFGFNLLQINKKRIPIYDVFNWDSTSLNTAQHFAQLINTKTFAAYDFGKKGNIERYGQDTVKLYNVTAINVPVTMFVGQNDYLVRPKSAKILYEELQPQYRNGFHLVPNKNWAHNSVLEAKDADSLLYQSVLDELE